LPSAPSGGLEHRDSAALIAPPGSFRPRKKYEDLLELFSHEHFHAWNVKRIRPRALGPFEYAREAYTRALWVMEGVTSYYDRHLLLRARLLGPKRYLEKLGEELARLRTTPGRLVQSLEESSFDAWIKFYKPDEATSNTTVSYYLKGSLVAAALNEETPPAPEGSESDGGWLGVQPREVAGGRSQIAITLAGGPAERAGLYPGDERVALDGFRVDERTLRERLGARRAGEHVRLPVLRRGELHEGDVAA